MKSFAIVVVCYNRVEGLKRLLSSLQRANYDDRRDVDLIFSIDNSGTSTVEDYAKTVEWGYGDKIIRTFPERQGLKKHILQCGDFTEKYDAIVVLEDDVVVSDSFFSYASQAVDFYWDNENIAGISLYTFQKNWLRWDLRFESRKNQYDTFFIKVAQSWGQVWMKKQWRAFKEWYEQHQTFVKDDTVPAYLNTWPESSWLKFHDRYCIENNKYFVYPYCALSTNTGAAGEHASTSSSHFQVELQFEKTQFSFAEFDEKAVQYDEYLNPVRLGTALGIPDEDLQVDLYETRKLSETKPYTLTTAKYVGVTPVKSYSLSFRPMEYSVLNNIPGEGIYLYHTVDILPNGKKVTNHSLETYEFRTDNVKTFLSYTKYLLVRALKKKLKFLR